MLQPIIKLESVGSGLLAIHPVSDGFFRPSDRISSNTDRLGKNAFSHPSIEGGCAYPADFNDVRSFEQLLHGLFFFLFLQKIRRVT